MTMKTNFLDPISVIWLINMYQKELASALQTRSNEHIWELGYNGPEPNPHTDNISRINKYILYLETKIEELKGE